MLTKQITGGIAALIDMYAFVPYFIGIYRKTTRPHALSWIVWGLVAGITCVAQVVKNGGPGAWVTGFEATGCMIVAATALISGEKNITRSDWYAFLAALAAIPLWVATGNPLWSVILVTGISLSGFWPTVRKSWHAPWGEVMQTYLLMGPVYALSLFSMQNLTWTTGLYPWALLLANGGFGLMLLVRRKKA